MAITPTDIIEAAYAKSTKNNPGSIATDATELLGVVNRAVRGRFSRIARVNPIWLATSSAVAFGGTGWTRPSAAQSVLRIELPSTQEVKVVPFDDRAAEKHLPAVYRLGKTYYPAGNASDPTTETLTFFYARFPTDAASVSANLDSAWEDQFNELLVIDVALYLAIKDGRADEIPGLTAERSEWERIFDEFLEHETANESRRWDSLNRIQTQVRRPIPGGEAQ